MLGLPREDTKLTAEKEYFKLQAHRRAADEEDIEEQTDELVNDG